MYFAFAASGATDWITGEKLALRGPDGDPHWHHIFPREHLHQHGVAREEQNVLANLALAASASNLAYGCDAPVRTWPSEMSTGAVSRRSRFRATRSCWA